MNRQKIKRLNLIKEKEIKEFSEVSTQELIEIYNNIKESTTWWLYQKILIKLLNYERRHNEMMFFNDLCTALQWKPNLNSMIVRRTTRLINNGLISYYFDDEYTNAYTMDEYYKFGLTPKGKRFIDFMGNKR